MCFSQLGKVFSYEEIDTLGKKALGLVPGPDLQFRNDGLVWHFPECQEAGSGGDPGRSCLARPWGVEPVCPLSGAVPWRASPCAGTHSREMALVGGQRCFAECVFAVNCEGGAELRHRKARRE